MKIEHINRQMYEPAAQKAVQQRQEEAEQTKKSDRITLDPSGPAAEKEASLQKPDLHQIKKEISRQTYLLLQMKSDPADTAGNLKTILGKSGYGGDSIGLGAYFSSHPEDLKTVSEGGIPDYFNMENTGQRILDIWLKSYTTDMDPAQFINEVKGYIGQAYSDVSALFGGLPDLVTDTREWIMAQLDSFAAEQSSAPA